MTPEAMRVAIGDRIGWRRLTPIGVWVAPDGTEHGQIPDWPTDLNACAEMRKMLNTDELRDSYVRYLYCMLDAPMPFEYMPLFRQFDITNATAPQHCEAFCRVMGILQE